MCNYAQVKSTIGFQALSLPSISLSILQLDTEKGIEQIRLQ
uniref:Uncharacterized protein n=1 Tax=Arundo donax TaxID=35708 RepID=A0A0A9GV50_ARUDO